ncbi:hypothetical protein AMTR_s00135p00030880 [Amborella trichopoda]|uniref:Peptidase A1 domain-containing protein n=2 Tax=Amborella trichopoda TaxID=13333 RepID=W1P7D7_AMBTC|nr:hypothetical protein AMTR_s00135p00030880 [Amborella trichopoda]
MAATALLLPVLLLSASVAATVVAESCRSWPDDADTLPILHIHGKCSPFAAPSTSSWPDTVMHMANNDPARLAYLANLATVVPIASAQQILHTGNYIVRAKFGTPGQLMFMVLDTSNDAAWVPCTNCSGCPSTPSAASFTPNSSSTYAPLPCTVPACTQARLPSCVSGLCYFNQSYGGDSSFSAVLSQDTLRLAMDLISNYTFGCVRSAAGGSLPPQGLLGLGRGPASLLSQAGMLYQRTFSYCLPSFKSYYFSGSLRLGPASQPKHIRTTPLLTSSHRPSLYYANLTAISIGALLVPVPGFNPLTGAGTIIDSGTVISRFVAPVYEAVRDEFKRVVAGPFSPLGAFDTCFPAPMDVPTVTLHFEGLDLVLPAENVLIHASEGSLACLAMAATPGDVNLALNVIANLQQQNHRLLFDLPNARLGIAREACN